MEWKTREIDLGVVEEGTKHEIVFEAVDNLDDVVYLSASCSCVVLRRNKNKIKAILKTGSFPYHLKDKQDTYTTTRIITVSFKDYTKDLLIITATIKKK